MGQIYIVETLQGLVIFIDIGLHFKNGQKMYLVAMENDPKWIEKMRWCIVGIMTKHRILSVFQIKNDFYFPVSSTDIARTYFGQALNFPLFTDHRLVHVLRKTKFDRLPIKTPKNPTKITRISVADFGLYCKQSLFFNYVIYAVVIKGKRTWVERKIPISIFDKVRNEWQCVCIGMKYNFNCDRFTIECVDCDVGQLYYQHRLLGLLPNDQHNYSYAELVQFCTTTLKFV